MPVPTDSFSMDTVLTDPTINENAATPADYVCLGREFKDQGKMNAALDCFQKALRLDPNLAEAAYCTGNILLLQKNPLPAKSLGEDPYKNAKAKLLVRSGLLHCKMRI